MLEGNQSRNFGRKPTILGRKPIISKENQSLERSQKFWKGIKNFGRKTKYNFRRKPKKLEKKFATSGPLYNAMVKTQVVFLKRNIFFKIIYFQHKRKMVLEHGVSNSQILGNECVNFA